MASTKLDHKKRPIVVVTGMGIVTALGTGKQDNWSALTAGRSGIDRIKRFATDNLRTTIAGQINFIDNGEYCASTMCYNLAVLAVEEAITQSAIGSRTDFPGPLFCAVPPFEVEWPLRIKVAHAYSGSNAPSENLFASLAASAEAGDWRDEFTNAQRESVAERLADTFSVRGQPISVSTACASGASAIHFGVEAIRRGECDAALCVGSDASVNPEAMVRFSLLSALTTRNDPPQAASRPFSRDRDGFVMGEGSAALIVESLQSATARGANILGVLQGCGQRADSFHRTRSNPDGAAIISALTNAFNDAGLAPSEIDYINPHGTGTPENDKMEYISLLEVFGDTLKDVPVSSNKSMIGHTLSAAGAIEAVFSLLTIENGSLPPTINYNIPDPEILLDVVPNKSRNKQVERVLSNSFGFGGQNISLVLCAEPV